MKKVYLLIVSLSIICITCFVSRCTSTHNYSRNLIDAIENDDHERFDKLLSEGKDLDATPYKLGIDKINMPPLHFACFKGKIEFVKKLIDAGAMVNNTNMWNGHTPLMVALESYNENRLIIAKYLIDNGADVLIKAYSRTALNFVFSSNIIDYSETKEHDDFEFALLLLEKGLTINDTSLGNIIFFASMNNNKLMVDYLINNFHVDINIIDDEYGNTALMWAVKNNCYNVVKYLIDNNANLNIENKEGKTAIELATENNNQNILNLFK